MHVKKYKEKKKMHRIYAGVVLVLGIAIAVISVLLLFYVQKIEITGNTYTNESEIKNWVKEDKLSKNSLYLLWKYKFAKPKMLPYLESAKAGLKAPWTVKITVVEKKIVGSIIFENQYVYFDKDGMVVYMSDQPMEGISQIEGIEVPKVEQYKELPVADKTVFQHILDVSQVLRKMEMAADKIVCSGTDINLYFGNVCVQLGTNNFEEKIAQIPPIIEKLAGEGGTLHLEHFGQGNQTISFIKGDIFAQPVVEPPAEEPQAEEDVQPVDDEIQDEIQDEEQNEE